MELVNSGTVSSPPEIERPFQPEPSIREEMIGSLEESVERLGGIIAAHRVNPFNTEEVPGYDNLSNFEAITHTTQDDFDRHLAAQRQINEDMDRRDGLRVTDIESIRSEISQVRQMIDELRADMISGNI